MALIAEQTKRLVSLHGWIAIALSILLYTVMLTGTVVVFSHEIGHWAEGKTETQGPLSRPIDRTFAHIAAQVPDALKDDVIVGEGPNGTLRFFFGSSQVSIEGGSGVYGRQYLMDPQSGTLVRAQTGFLGDLGQGNAAEALEDFLVDLHVRLHVPGRWGLYLTGTLGVVMLISAITGVLIHRNILRDFFVTERPGDRVVSMRDRHNLAGVWSLPFALLLSFTGAFLSFAVSLGLPVVAMVAFGGDQDAALEAVTGAPVIADATPAELSNLDDILARSKVIAGAPATVINIHRAGRADAIVETFHQQSGGHLRGMLLEFSGSSGTYLGQTHLVGTAASTGSTLAELTAPLHFGDFAGMASKIIWAALGAAMTFTIVSGVQLWARRRADDPVWRVGYRFFVVVAWAVPIAMLAAAYGYFLVRLAGDPVVWTARAFVWALILCAFAHLVWHAKPQTWLVDRLRAITAAMLIGLPFVRLQTGGVSWGEALLYDAVDILFVDTALIVCGLLFFLKTARRPAAVAA